MKIHDTARTAPDWLARVRSVCESPFAEEKGKTVYAAGFGAWGLWVNNTGWIYRGEFQQRKQPRSERNQHHEHTQRTTHAP